MLATEYVVKLPTEIGIYPLFPQKAAWASSIKHAMELGMKSTGFLNLDQTSVLGADQPLYAIIKLLQWQYPDTLGEYNLVAIMGGLHIEDTMHAMIDKLSEWVTTLFQAWVMTSGRAQSSLNEHHIEYTRYIPQVSLLFLCMLKQNAYLEYCANVMGPQMSFDMWDQHSKTVPQFKFWSTVMDIKLLMTRFVRSLREVDFKLYVQAFDELCAWSHALDHSNYSHWPPVHVRNMVQLAEKHPNIHDEFMKGNFVVQKSAKKFSLMA